MSRGARLRLAGLVGQALLLAAPAPAQLPDAPAAAAAPGALAPAPPAAIPGAEVADRAQEEDGRIQQVRGRTKPEPAIEEIERQLVVSAEEVAGLAATARERLATDVTRSDLERVSFDFGRLRDRLADWSTTLTAGAEGFDSDLALLGERRGVWQATREMAVADSQPAAVLARIDKTLAAIERADRAVRARRNQVLTLRESIARQQSAVASVLDRVASLRVERRRNLLALDRPPLWEAIGAAEPDQGGLLDRMSAARAHDLADLETFVRERSAQLLLLVLLTVGVVLGGVAFRAPARRLAEEDESLAAPARILERPIAAGIVMASVAAALLLPKAPPPVVSIHALVLLAATLRLLVPIVDPELRRILYGLTAWYAIDRLRDRLLPDPVANRLVLLAAAVLVVAVFLWLLRPARLAKLGQLARRGAWLRAIGVGMRLGVVLNAVSIVANLIGNTTLAEVLVEGTLSASLLAFVAYAATRALEGSWALLLRSPAARSLRMVRNHGPLLRRRGRSLIQIALTLGWSHLALERFDLVDPIEAAASRARGAEWRMGELSLSLGGVLTFWLMIYASFLVSRFVRFALEEDLLSRTSLPRGVPFAISTLARYAILLIGFGMAVLAAGFELNRLALVIGALGVGVGIGLQDIVNNVVSGVILLFERPVQVGDIVDVGNNQGEVRRIGIRSSTVRSFEGAELVIPNSKLVSETFVNWTLSDRQRRIEIPVGVSYGSDPDRVIELLKAVVTARPEVLQQPAPSALFHGFGQSSLDFLVRCWTPEPDMALVVRSQLALDVYRALREAGIGIPFPQRDLHLRSVDPAAGRALAGEAAPETRALPAVHSRPG